VFFWPLETASLHLPYFFVAALRLYPEACLTFSFHIDPSLFLLSELELRFLDLIQQPLARFCWLGGGLYLCTVSHFMGKQIR